MRTLEPTDIQEIPPADPSEIRATIEQIIGIIDQRTLGNHREFPGVNSPLLKEVLGQEKTVNAAILKFIAGLVTDMIRGDSLDLRERYHLLMDICAVNKTGELFLALYQLLGAIRRLTTRGEDKQANGPIILEIAVSSARQVLKKIPTYIEDELLWPLVPSSEHGNKRAVLAIMTGTRTRLLSKVSASKKREAHTKEIERLTAAVQKWCGNHVPAKPPHDDAPPR